MANMTNKITRRSFGALALGSFGALALAACGSSNTSGSSSSASASATGKKVAPSALPSGMGTTTVDGEFPRTVKHFRGETTIKSAPSKVVILSTGQLDGVLSLGVVPVGAATAGDADLVPTYLKTKFSNKSAELDKIAKVGKRTDPDVEAIANLKPDLILINNTNKKDELYESLAKIAPTVVTEGTGIKRLAARRPSPSCTLPLTAPASSRSPRSWAPSARMRPWHVPQLRRLRRPPST